MPRGDGTGPRGRGAATGRSLGGCRAKEAGDVRKSGGPEERRASCRQGVLGPGPGLGGAVMRERGKVNDVTIWDVFFSWLALISRK